jgi:hypothetical protein
MGNRHLLEAGKLCICKGGKGEQSDGKKDGNKHLLEAGKAIYVKAGRGEKSDGKKDGQ